jgi:hypothetical protein
MASKARPSFAKRQRERDQKQRRMLKDERRDRRKAERLGRSDSPVGDSPEVDGIPADPADSMSEELVPAGTASARGLAPPEANQEEPN